MLHYPAIDPVALSLGPFQIYWYAISYLVGIGIVWWTVKYRNNHYQHGWSGDDISDMVFYGTIGVILGGRFGYMFFYGWENLLADPSSILRIWEGGMSFHGGLIGVSLAIWVYAQKKKTSIFAITDLFAPSIPIALGCGRIGNFINAELPGRVTDVPWALVYPGDTLARHPSSLYQAILEGPVLLCALWLFAMKPRPAMAISGAFLLGYGILRNFSELFREPDSHLGFVLLGQVTQGQLLSVPMILLGIILIAYSYTRQNKSAVQRR